MRYLKSEVIFIFVILEEWNLNWGSIERILEGLFGQGNAINSQSKVPKNKVASCLLYSVVEIGFNWKLPRD